ncbi:MAG TPA: phosphomannomutase/phosphoglucomutase [Acidimicrobiales bacterium]|nr:phosphomannomutase/phosphoglucomutase [Acidimicrobiales bacterium]
MSRRPTTSDRPPSPGAARLSVVVPAYEEHDRIAASIDAIRGALGTLDGGLEIVVVDDGSTDGTAEVARAAGADIVLVHDSNRGKGAAVRTGVRGANGRTVAFTDADLSYAPSQLSALLGEVESGWDVAVGSRAHADTRTVVRPSIVRSVGGRVINWLTRPVLRSRHRDTQCGIKAFRSDVARFIFGRARIDGFAFDVELFAIVERNGLALTEVPVIVSNTSRSTVHAARDGWRLVRDLLRIRKWARAGVYDGPGELASLRMPAYDAVFKAYDIRGLVPDELDAVMCRAIGAAFARFSDAGRVLVARDMRPSGVELSSAFADGVRSQGIDVVDLGMASTDLVYYAAGTLDAPGAMFTASHNPAQYNGIKLCLAGAKPVGVDTGLLRIKDMAERGCPDADHEGKLMQDDLLDDFAVHVRSFVDVGSLTPLRVIADTANGMGGLVVPIVFDPLPFELEVMYGELDGTFPNHPADPIQPANLRDLIARVQETRADVGLAFDGDADRVFLVDDKGVPVSGSTTTAIVAKAVLAREPGATILYNCICSKAVAEIVRENGGTPIRTRVGHSFIKAVMAETGAAFGGEHSAHYYFRDNYRADSGSIAALVVLEQLCVAGVPLSELRKPFERYAQSGEVNLEFVDPQAVIDRVAEAYEDADQDRLDGLTVDLGDWWFNVRPSNTEPLLRLNLEARTPAEVERHVAEVKAAMGE